MSQFPPLVAQKVKTLGYEVSFNVPSTVEHFDALAGEVGSALKSAIMNVIYRSCLNEFRDTFTERLATITGKPRKTKDTGKTRKVKSESENPDGTTVVTETVEAIIVWDETESDYFNRVVAEIMASEGKGKEEVEASFTALALEVASTITFDPAERQAAPAGPKKVAKVYLDTATKIVADGRAEVVAGKLSALLNRTVASDVLSLANAIAEDQRRKAKEALAGL